MIVTDSRVVNWVKYRTGLSLGATAVGIGEERNGKLIAGVSYDCWTKNNVFVSLAVDESPSKLFWATVADYPFEKLNCQRVTAMIESSNDKSLSIAKHGGFAEECRLKGAAADGSDLVMHVLRKDDCRVFNWRRK
jgi:hypothetical protein